MSSGRSMGISPARASRSFLSARPSPGAKSSQPSVPASENGNWSPHLHFQIVTDHLGLGGRMRGVGVREQWQVWRAVSPDPSVVLGFSTPASVIVERDKNFLVRERHRALGRSLSIAYSAAPLKIVGGEGAHLIDEEGTRWLEWSTMCPRRPLPSARGPGGAERKWRC